jgi:glycosyltransferase involved in cell wall biosynthesis
MKISVVIPTYNSAATIRLTLDSVLAQTSPPDEIIVLDDGSADATPSIVGAYVPQVTLHRQKNHGVAHARNVLCNLAQGDLLAFLDHDDLWHPRYLETQLRLFELYPDAGASFTSHVNFDGSGLYAWPHQTSEASGRVEVIDSLDFFVQYNKATGPFGSMSYCCLPKSTLVDLGADPFRVSGVDDSYLCCKLALTGRPVIFSHAPLVAYRLAPEAQSNNKLRADGLWVDVFQALESRFLQESDSRIRVAFRAAFAAKRRSYAKVLMGVGKSDEARSQLRVSLLNSFGLTSQGKSLAMLLLTYLPRQLQPAWPSSFRASVCHIEQSSRKSSD